MRVHQVGAARKPQGTCPKCSQPIEVGQAYQYINPRFGAKVKRHATQECNVRFRASETVSNEKLSTLYQAQEIVEDAGGEPEALAEAMEAAADLADEAAQMYRDSQEAMEEGFGHATYGSDEQGEMADQAEEFAQSLREAGEEITAALEARDQAQTDLDEAEAALAGLEDGPEKEAAEEAVLAAEEALEEEEGNVAQAMEEAENAAAEWPL